MASLSQLKNGSYLCQWFDKKHKRRTLTLRMPLALAERVRTHVEALNAAALVNVSPPAESLRWAEDIADDLHAKLVGHGLVQARADLTPELETFVTALIADRRDWAANTRKNARKALARMIPYFGARRTLGSITRYDAEQFGRWLKLPPDKPRRGQNGKQPYADATVNNTLKLAVQFFEVAIAKRLLQENPFTGVKRPPDSNEEREFFVSQEMIRKVMEQCPDAEWRLLIALARWEGMRMPSEPLALTWPDVLWDQNRIRVAAPKTGVRWTPLFPEVRPYLQEIWEQALPGAMQVITRHRATLEVSGNLRTSMARILRRAGIEPWERLFQNLRSSRETELVNQGWHEHKVCKWLGNSPKVARKHYLQVLDDDFDRAAAGGLNVPSQGELFSEAEAASIPSDPADQADEESEPPRSGQYRPPKRMAPSLDLTPPLQERRA